MLMDGIEPPQTRSDLECPYCHSHDSEPLGVLHNNISIIQRCLHPLIVFDFLLLFASLYYITAWTKKYYVITKEERSSSIIKFAVIKLRGGFKPHFCHTRPVVCPSWTSVSSTTRKHCNCEYWELPPRVISSVSNLHIRIIRTTQSPHPVVVFRLLL